VLINRDIPGLPRALIDPIAGVSAAVAHLSQLGHEYLDRKANEYAVASRSRVFSAYTLSSGQKIWVITEADRSTTILLPEEY
jgi:hypothetical protein